MSVVIVGGHDRMVRQYMDICKKYNCKSKVFTQLPHIMANGAVQEAEKNKISIARSHSSSSSALKRILEEYCHTC